MYGIKNKNFIKILEIKTISILNKSWNIIFHRKPFFFRNIIRFYISDILKYEPCVIILNNYYTFERRLKKKQDKFNFCRYLIFNYLLKRKLNICHSHVFLMNECIQYFQQY